MKLRTLTRIGLALALALAAAEPARATSLAPLTTVQLTDAATWIVEGKVLDVWTEVDEDGAIWTRARVQVDVLHKGTELPRTIVVDTLGGALGRFSMPIDGSPRFSADESVVLFLAEIDHGRRMATVGMEQGKFTVRRPAGDTRRIVQHATAPMELPYDARFVPYPKAADRVYLDDLLEQVESRLDVGWQGEAIPGISATSLAEINTPDRRLRR